MSKKYQIELRGTTWVASSEIGACEGETVAEAIFALLSLECFDEAGACEQHAPYLVRLETALDGIAMLTGRLLRMLSTGAPPPATLFQVDQIRMHVEAYHRTIVEMVEEDGGCEEAEDEEDQDE